MKALIVGLVLSAALVLITGNISYSSGMRFAENCAAQEIISGYPVKPECAGFTAARLKILSEYYSEHPETNK